MTTQEREEIRKAHDALVQARDSYDNSGLGQREECWQRVVEAEAAYNKISLDRRSD